MNDAYEWEKAKKYCETMDSHKTDTGARGRLWYPHSEEEQKRVGRWLVGKVKPPIFMKKSFLSYFSIHIVIFDSSKKKLFFHLKSAELGSQSTYFLDERG